MKTELTNEEFSRYKTTLKNLTLHFIHANPATKGLCVFARAVPGPYAPSNHKNKIQAGHLISLFDLIGYDDSNVGLDTVGTVGGVTSDRDFFNTVGVGGKPYAVVISACGLGEDQRHVIESSMSEGGMAFYIDVMNDRPGDDGFGYHWTDAVKCVGVVAQSYWDKVAPDLKFAHVVCKLANRLADEIQATSPDAILQPVLIYSGDFEMLSLVLDENQSSFVSVGGSGTPINVHYGAVICISTDDEVRERVADTFTEAVKVWMMDDTCTARELRCGNRVWSIDGMRIEMSASDVDMDFVRELVAEATASTPTAWSDNRPPMHQDVTALISKIHAGKCVRVVLIASDDDYSGAQSCIDAAQHFGSMKFALINEDSEPGFIATGSMVIVATEEPWVIAKARKIVDMPMWTIRPVLMGDDKKLTTVIENSRDGLRYIPSLDAMVSIRKSGQNAPNDTPEPLDDHKLAPSPPVAAPFGDSGSEVRINLHHKKSTPKSIKKRIKWIRKQLERELSALMANGLVNALVMLPQEVIDHVDVDHYRKADEHVDIEAYRGSHLDDPHLYDSIKNKPYAKVYIFPSKRQLHAMHISWIVGEMSYLSKPWNESSVVVLSKKQFTFTTIKPGDVFAADVLAKIDGMHNETYPIEITSCGDESVMDRVVWVTKIEGAWSMVGAVDPDARFGSIREALSAAFSDEERRRTGTLFARVLNEQQDAHYKSATGFIERMSFSIHALAERLGVDVDEDIMQTLADCNEQATKLTGRVGTDHARQTDATGQRLCDTACEFIIESRARLISELVDAVSEAVENAADDWEHVSAVSDDGQSDRQASVCDFASNAAGSAIRKALQTAPMLNLGMGLVAELAKPASPDAAVSSDSVLGMDHRDVKTNVSAMDATITKLDRDRTIKRALGMMSVNELGMVFYSAVVEDYLSECKCPQDRHSDDCWLKITHLAMAGERSDLVYAIERGESRPWWLVAQRVVMLTGSPNGLDYTVSLISAWASKIRSRAGKNICGGPMDGPVSVRGPQPGTRRNRKSFAEWLDHTTDAELRGVQPEEATPPVRVEQGVELSAYQAQVISANMTQMGDLIDPIGPIGLPRDNRIETSITLNSESFDADPVINEKLQAELLKPAPAIFAKGDQKSVKDKVCDAVSRASEQYADELDRKYSNGAHVGTIQDAVHDFADRFVVDFISDALGADDGASPTSRPDDPVKAWLIWAATGKGHAPHNFSLDDLVVHLRSIDAITEAAVIATGLDGGDLLAKTQRLEFCHAKSWNGSEMARSSFATRVTIELHESAKMEGHGENFSQYDVEDIEHFISKCAMLAIQRAFKNTTCSQIEALDIDSDPSTDASLTKHPQQHGWSFTEDFHVVNLGKLSVGFDTKESASVAAYNSAMEVKRAAYSRISEIAQGVFQSYKAMAQRDQVEPMLTNSTGDLVDELWLQMRMASRLETQIAALGQAEVMK